MNRRPQLFGKTLFLDLLMNTLAMVIAVMLLTKIESEKKAEEASVKTEGIYAIVIEWPHDSRDDVDLYVRDPNGNIVYFSARDLSLMHLEHDDQGDLSDKTKVKGQEVKVLMNEERVIIRGAIEGEYTVNVHMYNKRTVGPTTVTAHLIRLIGGPLEVAKKERVLVNGGAERTMFRFILAADGALNEVNELERTLTGKGVQ